MTASYRFHEVSALRALMHAARSLRENGDYDNLHYFGERYAHHYIVMYFKFYEYKKE